jgi:hypothetical protein
VLQVLQMLAGDESPEVMVVLALLSLIFSPVWVNAQHQCLTQAAPRDLPSRAWPVYERERVLSAHMEEGLAPTYSHEPTPRPVLRQDELDDALESQHPAVSQGSRAARWPGGIPRAIALWVPV